MENNDKKLEWTKRMNNETVKVDMEAISIEQEKVVQKLKKALDFFENVKIKNKESLDNVKKPLDDLLSSLKYVPVEEGPGFNDLPPEIKTEILDYNCDSGIFVAASVCREWKIILEPRLDDLEYVSIGKCCFTDYGYPHEEFGVCFMPQEKLKASAILGLDIPLEVCHPLTNIDSDLIVEGLMSVSDFKIINDCHCREDDQGRTDDEEMLTKSQTKHLFDAIEKETEINSVELRGLDMTHLDQHKLINCLFKINKLTLAEGCRDDWVYGYGEPDPILNFELFVERLLQTSIDSANFKLSSLRLEYLNYPQSLSVDLAKALCNVKAVTIGQYFPLRTATLKQMIQNVLTGGIRMKSLYIHRDFKWHSLITSEDLRTLITRMKRISLDGNFSQEQVDTVKSMTGVNVSTSNIWSKIWKN